MNPTRRAGMPYPLVIPDTEMTWLMSLPSPCSEAMGTWTACGSVRWVLWVTLLSTTMPRLRARSARATSSSRVCTVPNGFTGSQTTIIFVRGDRTASTSSGSSRYPLLGVRAMGTTRAPHSSAAGTKWK